MCYIGYIQRNTPITAAELVAVDKMIREKVFSRIQVRLSLKKYFVMVRSSALSENPIRQHMQLDSIPNEDWIEEMLTGDIFGINFCIIPKECLVELELKSLKGNCGHLMLVKCHPHYRDILEPQLEEIFSDAYQRGHVEARLIKERLDATTWDPIDCVAA